MGLQVRVKTAQRSLTRRKTKNFSAILAIMLGVTLMVGVQITTETLRETFYTSLLLSEGEVDLTVSSINGYPLKAADQENISRFAPDALGIMPELKTEQQVLIGSQFDPNAYLVGIPLDYPEVFGQFTDWQTGEEMNITTLLKTENSILLGSNLAESLGLEQSESLPVIVKTEFVNVSLTPLINETTGFPVFNATTGKPIMTTAFSIEPVNFSITGIYDGNRPGIGSRYGNTALMPLDQLQNFISWQDPFGETDIIDRYLISYKTDHFNHKIDRNYLQEQLEDVEKAIPEKENPITGEMDKVYLVTSPRLNFYEFADVLFNLLNTMLTALGLLIIVTGLLLITNIQLMSVDDREFLTGVLRAVGENRRGIFTSFFIETVFQGFLGGLLGLGGGIVFGWIVAFYLSGLFGTGQMSVAPVIQPTVIALAVILGVVIAILTGLFPALRASQVNIVEALRGIKLQFEDKSSRNFFLIGLVIGIVGLIILWLNWGFDSYIYLIGPFTDWIYDFNLNNQITDYILGSNSWNWRAGYNSIAKWENILLGGGLLFTGLGIVLSSYIDRVKAMNITALALWILPVFTLTIGIDWLEESTGQTEFILIYSLLEIIIGSVMIVGLNLPPLMQALRSVLIQFKGFKGVAQISPSLISSHKVQSTLTFAIFAVVLTLNVTVATIVETNFVASISQSEDEARGVDIYTILSKPDTSTLNGTTYAQEIAKLDDRIEDVIPFKTSDLSSKGMNMVALKDPSSPAFNPKENFVPLKFVEIGADQIRGQAKDATEENWRYDYRLRQFPDGVREELDLIPSNEELDDASRRSYDLLMDPNYEMIAYNTSLSAAGGRSTVVGPGSHGGPGGLMSNEEELSIDDALVNGNGSIITNPIVFTDSFWLSVGTQIWVPMNTTTYGGVSKTNYQVFTVAGCLDDQAGGFPIGIISGFGSEMEGNGISTVMGSILIPERWSNMTNFFGEADGITPYSRTTDQYDSFLIKTSLNIDDSEVEVIAQKIEDYTNSDNGGYRSLIGDFFVTASADTIFSLIETELEMRLQMMSFLQIYVSFGLVIGAVGMAVIAVRNVAERKREIGMMRAIGFPQSQVIMSVLLELFVLGIIGLVIGIINGLIVNVGFAILMDSTMVIPWTTIGIYLAFITLVAFISGAIPGWTASRIPPSEALRYVG